MLVRLRHFAVVREILGRGEEQLELPAGTTLADLVQQVTARDPRLERLRPVLRAARNLAMALGDAVLGDGDEVALIPPVAGAVPTGQRFRLCPDGVSLDEAVAQVSHPGAGAVVTFTGMVRDVHDGRQVVRLEYEAYPEMVARVLADVGAAVEAQCPGVRLCILHRTGSLKVGERAVVIAASAPHRPDAFEACREAIRRVQRDVPVWKRELGEDGATWVNLEA